MTSIAQNRENDQRKISATLKKIFHRVRGGQAAPTVPGRETERCIGLRYFPVSAVPGVQ